MIDYLKALDDAVLLQLNERALKAMIKVSKLKLDFQFEILNFTFQIMISNFLKENEDWRLIEKHCESTLSIKELKSEIAMKTLLEIYAEQLIGNY